MSKQSRIAVFIDYQNCYGAARRAFHRPSAPGACGQFVPQAMARILAANRPAGGYRLAYVGAYCGVAHPHKDPKTAAARQKQLAAWERAGDITIVTRPLRYPQSWPREKAQEKGIDVKLAIDAIMLAVQRTYDIGVIASCDTDLSPLAEAVLALPGPDGPPQVAVVAWEGSNQRIRVSGRRIPCHRIDAGDYRAMQDPTDYTL